MFADALPRKKIGYLGPRHVIENQPYEFYRMAPPGIILVMVSCGLEHFTAQDVERVTGPIDKMLDLLVERDVEIINQVGVPLPLLVGLEAHDALVKHIADYTGKMASSQLMNVIAALKHLGIRKVLAVNKWRKEMNDNLDRFLRREGMELAGVSNKVLVPQEFSKINTEDSAQLAYDLAVAGVKAFPQADGIFIGGGSWLSQPVAEQVEAETGLPVVTNIGAMTWNLLHRIGCWEPVPGRGRLLSGD
jgi:maleate cis-trans isomerase